MYVKGKVSVIICAAGKGERAFSRFGCVFRRRVQLCRRKGCKLPKFLFRRLGKQLRLFRQFLLLQIFLKYDKAPACRKGKIGIKLINVVF